jgi:hypothetical protein
VGIESNVLRMSPRVQETVERAFEKAGQEHPEYCEALEKAWDLLAIYRTQENRWLLDSLFQEDGDRRPECVDMAFSSELVFQLMKGRLYYVGVDIRRPPVEGPAERLLNEITLATIGAPFKVEFMKVDGERRGQLSWDKPVTVHCHRAGGTHLTRQLEPGSACLEIGYTRAVTTGLVLKERGLLARWPHGHSFVYLLYTDLKGLFEGIADPSRWLSDRI